jgi:hypothetical protein
VSLFGNWWITGNGISQILRAATLDEAIRIFGDIIDQTYALAIVTEAMIAGGAIVLVLIMVRIERRCAARDREIRAAVLA